MKTKAILFILFTTLVFQSCAIQQESLLIPDAKDRRIVGYQQGIIFKKRTYYKVVDGRGCKAPRVREYSEKLAPVGSFLICEY